MNPLAIPGCIGGVEIPSRVVMAPMTTRLATDEGKVTPEIVAYYSARAKSGVGLITVEMASPEPAGRHRFNELGIYDDRFLPGLRELAEAIRSYGSVPGIQLGHGGGHTSLRISGRPPVAPSAVPHSLFEIGHETVIPEAMTTERIAEVVDAFVEAAARAYAAGFEVVEIHGAHGYLISQFLCPAENLRTDAYGGSLKNRARLALEIIQAIKKRCVDGALVFRFDSENFFPGGMTAPESLQLGEWAARAGADALHVTGGHYRSIPSAERMIPPMQYGYGCFVEHASALRKRVGVPVIAVGRLGDPTLAAKVLSDNKADFIALGRPLLADPKWLSKALAGKAVRLCLACNTCVNGMRGGATLHCLVNPRTGRETRWSDTLSHQRKKIAVIGSGPAGLSYALEVAKENRVTIFERRGFAGGAFNLVGHAPLFQDVRANPDTFRAFITSLVEACEAAGVRFRFSSDPSRDNSLLRGFDHVVVATGARYPLGTGWLVEWLLRKGIGNLPPLRQILSTSVVREWFYYRLRGRNDMLWHRLLNGEMSYEIIGDAISPGKSMDAIESAHRAAYGPPADTTRKE